MVRKIVPILACVLLAAVWACTGAAEEEGKKELKPALLVIDVQNVWMPRMAEKDRQVAPEKINEAIALFREFQCPVIRVYHTSPTHGPEPGTEPFEFDASILVSDDDPKVVKNYPSAFAKTNLDEILRDSERNTLFLCGLSATGCALATYFGAMERDYTVFMIEDALLSGNADHTDVIEQICYSATVEDARKILDDPTLLLGGTR